ncbi:aromatic peroxygenase precursor [Ephemerocybe angulata]|uniref:Aromatic peroxygenase n=1 Tax=Ephemerocybe angulata TaxID=980116 RepID=A0A8H6HDQ0_9AGAR|nr:aromatic peroxygenase precursor [Tulosesus angulatus]
MRLNSSFLQFYALLIALSSVSVTFAFPAYGSLGGLSARQVEAATAGFPAVLPPGPPPPLTFSGAKLVNDKAHPYKAPRPGDIRGPCPGLNTLANHGYLPSSGVATPAQIITATQEGFNFAPGAARFATYSAHLVDGNLVTDLLSIGGKTAKTGPDTGAPAIIGGLNTHSVFEGDASMTRADFHWGDNHSFNQTQFDLFVEYSNKYGGGFYNLTVAAELRHRRIQDGIATNPEFDLTAIRFFTAFGESSFPYSMFVDGRITERATAGLDMTNATLIFRDGKYPKDFWRAPEPTAGFGIIDIFNAHPIKPGRNENGVNTYTVDPDAADFSTPCKRYTDFLSKTVVKLYPNPTGVLRRNLILNLGFLYDAQGVIPDCPQVFPYGQL